MSTGFTDDDGTVRRLLCAGPPDGGSGVEGAGGSGPGGEIGRAITAATGSPLGPDDFVPNCYINGPVAASAATATQLTPGLNDFSVEAWIMPFDIGHALDTSNNPNISTGNLDGLFVRASTGPDIRTVLATNAPAAPAAVLGAWVAIPDGWHYYVANFDRDVNATLYIDGFSRDTVNINAHVLEDMSARIFSRTNSRAVTVATGPQAWHVGLLTGGQMADSMRRRSVQVFGGTLGAWDWRLIGQTGWEARPDFIPASYYSYGPSVNRPISMPWAVPIGVNTTVISRDLTGGTHLMNIRTATAYTTASTLGVAFGSDPFFK